MPLFGRSPKGPGRAGGHPLVTPDVLDRMAKLGRARYEGIVDVWDLWPTNYHFDVEALSPQGQQRYLDALLSAVRSVGGWVIYGAEEIVDGVFGSPGHGNSVRDSIFETAIDFQREVGVWWQALSPMEQMFWQDRHPGEVWLLERDSPSREAAKITPLQVGEERRVSMLTAAADAKAMFVAHPDAGRYVLELDYPDDNGDRLRDPRDEAGDLYELYWRFGRGVPFSGVWVDPEFEPFLRYPMPRI